MENDGEEEITDEEIERQIGRLKKKKAAGANGIGNEVWIYSKGHLRRKLKEIIRKVWGGEGFPEKWKIGIIAPIFKKGDMEEVTNYKGVTLLCTAYKIYAAVFAERLRQ